MKQEVTRSLPTGVIKVKVILTLETLQEIPTALLWIAYQTTNFLTIQQGT